MTPEGDEWEEYDGRPPPDPFGCSVRVTVAVAAGCALLAAGWLALFLFVAK